MEYKPKIGVLFITSGWFRDVGLQSHESSFSDEIEKIGKEIVSQLSDFMIRFIQEFYFQKNPPFGCQKINEEEVDGLIISPLMWCEDQILRAA